MTAPAHTLLRRTDRLVAQSVLVAILLAWLVLGGFDAVTAFGSELDEVGEGGYDVLSRLLWGSRTALLVIIIPVLVWDSDQRGFHDKIAGTVLIRG